MGRGGSLYIVALAALSEGTAIYTYLVIRRRVAARRPWLAAAPLLAPIAILTLFNVWAVGASR